MSSPSVHRVYRVCKLLGLVVHGTGIGSSRKRSLVVHMNIVSFKRRQSPAPDTQGLTGVVCLSYEVKTPDRCIHREQAMFSY